MRSNRRIGSRQRARNDGSFWLSFSDLMSSLVLIIILVMFYIIYQYFNLAEINQAEIARREYQLSETQAELENQQTKLTDAEKQMIAQQILLDAKEKELTSAQAVLEDQKSQLANTQAQLTEKESEIAAQQAQLSALSAQLTVQQDQLDEQTAQLSIAQDQLATQQFQLSEQEAALVLAQRQLSDQEAELLLAQAQLAAQEAELLTAQDQLFLQQSQIDSQQAQLQNQQAQLEALVGVRTRIITSLSSALKVSGISATVDPVNGSIALESDVLFSSGQYTLSRQGRAFVDSFLPVYLEVLFSEEYRPFVAEIIVEGHTDSVGSYISNLELSQQRANEVASYVLSDGYTVLDARQRQLLRDMSTANGRSFSDPVLDAYGNEDKDASRRVVFKFRLTDEQMIEQLKQILERNDSGPAAGIDAVIEAAQ